MLFGSVKAQDGRPVLCVLDLQPVEDRLVINDMQKVNSAYTKDESPVSFVRSSRVLYVSENKKRTTALLRSIGFQMPIELQPCGSMGSIAYIGRAVKIEGVNFTELESGRTESGRKETEAGIRYQLENGAKDADKTGRVEEQQLYPGGAARRSGDEGAAEAEVKNE